MIESISAQGEFGLVSGRTVRLLDIRLPLGEDEFARSLAWLQSLAGRRVTVAALAGEDRWRRNVADLALLDEPAPIDLAELLVAEGLAMVDAGNRNALCRPGLLAEEERARTRRAGVWRNGGHAPVDANDGARLEALIGSFALVEGIVRNVGERRERTYLNFRPGLETRSDDHDSETDLGHDPAPARALRGNGSERPARPRAGGSGKMAGCRRGDHGARHARSAWPGYHTTLNMMQSLPSRWLVGTAAALATLLASCAGEQTGSLSPMVALPPEVPRVTGLERSAEREHARLISAFGGEYEAPQARAVLSEIAARLVPATERPDEAYRITLLDSPVVNAFALPSGRLYVTRGLLALANDTAEVAAVLAHEIAHVTVRHASARSELELRSVLVSRVMADVLQDPVASAMVRDQSRVSMASFSRAQELEADQVGVRTLAKAGYDPYGAARFLGSLGRASGLLAQPPNGASAGASAETLSTHPSTPERISLALQAARRIGAPGFGEADRGSYLKALDGIAYGDDPADGIVRGRRFMHPRLGVAFEAPDGMTIENTSRAVVGTSPDGGKRILFDAVESPEDQSLETVLEVTWNDAVETGSVENLSVNGHPAAIASSRGKDWAFRLAAMRVKGTTYRLVLAMRPSNGDLDRAFRQTLDSIREVTADEARDLRPLRLQVLTAREGDTAEKLAGRMAGLDHPVERFLSLNGLARSAPLTPGNPYKVIVE